MLCTVVVWMFYSNQAEGRRRQLDPNLCCFPSYGSVPLLSHPLVPLPGFLAAISHGILFSCSFRLCSSTREPLFVVAGVPYVYAVKSITAAAYI